VILFLVVTTFAPILFIHPFRVRDYGRWPPLLAAAWAIASTALLWFDTAGPARSLCLALSVASAVILVALGLLRTVRGERA